MNLEWLAAAVLGLALAYSILTNSGQWSRLRRALRIPTIDTADAIRAAQAACAERGWPWRDPVRVEQTPTRYRLMTNANFRGGNAIFVVTMRTGEVRHATLMAR